MSVTWVLKGSKLCNLRCKYCYEWDDLANPTRMSLVVWRQAFELALDVHRSSAAKNGRASTYFVWHGGEPLLLPWDYFSEVLQLQRQILAPVSGEYANALQTNLYRVPLDMVEWLANNHGFSFGVSVDVVGGVRVNAVGMNSEATVVQNIDSLRAKGIVPGGIAVISKNNFRHLRRVHDFYAERGMPFRLLPLSAGPDSRDSGGFNVDAADVVRGLCEVFEYRWELGFPIPLDPLDGYMQAVLLKIAGIGRTSLGELPEARVYLVNTDGCVYFRRDAYVANQAISDLNEEALPESFLENVRHSEYIAQARARRGHVCKGCEFNTVCDGTPILEVLSAYGSDECHVAKPVMSFIERFLRQQGVSGQQLLDDIFGLNRLSERDGEKYRVATMV